MQQNQIRQPLILVFAVTVLLSLLSFINTTKLFSTKIKPVDLFADLKPTIKDTTTQKIKTTIEKTKTEKYELAIQDYSRIEKNSFSHFSSLLQNAKTNKVRIAYFGDSFIESDLVTNELRQLLQKQYGGCGVGFVPMECVNSEMRKSVVQTTNSSWVIHENASKLLIAFTANDSYTKYSLQQPYKNCTTAKLFYQSAQNSSIQIETDSNRYEKILPQTNNTLSVGKINQTHFSTLKISSTSSATNFYGISFEDSTGVYVDNFSLRGSNGTHLLKLDTTTLQQFNAIQKYNLIVLHFGVNVLTNNDKLDWYKIGLQKTIQFLQQQMPNAAILIISTSDKATKTNGIYETDKGVTPLVNIQKEIAQKNGVIFWNLYQNMGGYNSMLNWVNADTALAYKDYTHINFKGAAKVANLLYQQITNFK